MAPSSTLVTVVFIFSISLLPCTSVCYSRNSKVGGVEREKVLGSRPPGCVNKCFNCKPCIATLVVPSLHQHDRYKIFSFGSASPLKDEDDTYYLLSWKCRCGDKLFEP